jgi:hypothetical protein
VRPRSDDVPEMPRRRPIDDQAVDRILHGDAAGGELGGLQAFVSDVRAAAAGPLPAPSPALEQVLTWGLSTDQGDLPATAAINANGPALQAAGLPKWRSATMKMSRYVTGLSMAAKITLGVGGALALTAGAAAAGVLPGPVQSAVDAVTPFNGATGTGDTTASPSVPPGDSAPGTAPGAGTGTGDKPPAGTPSSRGTDTGGDAPGVVPGTGSSPGGGTKTEPTPPPSTEPAPPTTQAPNPGEPTPPPPTEAPPTTVPETPTPESMTMHCEPDAAHTLVHCEWTLAPPTGFGHYVLLRTSSDAKPGRVLVQSGDITYHNWNDSLDLTPGVAYSYMVITIGADGTTTTGHSNHVTLVF